MVMDNAAIGKETLRRMVETLGGRSDEWIPICCRNWGNAVQSNDPMANEQDQRSHDSEDFRFICLSRRQVLYRGLVSPGNLGSVSIVTRSYARSTDHESNT